MGKNRVDKMTQTKKEIKLIQIWQRKLIWMWTGKKYLNWDNEAVHAFCNVESLNKLSFREANDCINTLKTIMIKQGIEFEDSRNKKNTGKQEQRAELEKIFFQIHAKVQNINQPSPEQRKYIIDMVMRVFDANPVRFKGWLKKYFGLSWIANRKQAQKIIDPLERMDSQLKEKKEQ